MRFLFTILIALLLSSCNCRTDKIEKELLPGRYIFTHWTRDTIDIMENGTYQHYTVINNTKLKNSGTWKLMETQEEILFENFSFLTDENPPGNWFSRLRLEEEEIQLIYACDINAYYKRIGGLDSLDINYR